MTVYRDGTRDVQVMQTNQENTLTDMDTVDAIAELVDNEGGIEEFPTSDEFMSVAGLSNSRRSCNQTRRRTGRSLSSLSRRILKNLKTKNSTMKPQKCKADSEESGGQHPWAKTEPVHGQRQFKEQPRKSRQPTETWFV